MTAPAPADLIVVDARVLTMDAARPRAEAVACRDGRVLAVGDRAEVAALAGPGARVIEAGGATVLPGFVEAHMHLFPGAAELDHLQLGEVEGADAAAAAARAYAASRPDEAVLIAQGAAYTLLGAGRRLDRHALDAMVPNRPFAIAAFDHHTMWANTAALRLAGLLHGREVGVGNEVVMGPDGLADGELRESEAFGPLLALAGGERARLGLSTGGEPDPAPTPEARAFDRAILKRGLAHLARAGITSFHNMDGNAYQLELLEEIRAEGALTARARIPFHFKNFMEVEALEKASWMAGRWADDWLRSGFVKMFIDGVTEGWTAVMAEDYADRPGWRGEPLFEPARFRAIVTEADRRGLQVAVHAIGDGAVGLVLDAYEAAATANGRRDSRHRVEHVETIRPNDVPRFAALGVVASMQPLHRPDGPASTDDPVPARIGRARWPHAYPTDTLRRAGARIAFASDWPVSPVEPMRSVQAAVARTPWAEGLSAERSTLHEALAHYTVDGAWTGFEEDRKGRLAPGLLADLVVLSEDVEAVAPEALATVRPVTTVCGGAVVWEG